MRFYHENSVFNIIKSAFLEIYSIISIEQKAIFLWFF